MNAARQIVEEVTEAVIRPDAEALNRVRRVMKTLPDFTKEVRNAHLIDERNRILRDYLKRLTRALASHRFSGFKIGGIDLGAYTDGGGFARDGLIYIEVMASKSKEDIDGQILAILGHELVHAEQLKRQKSSMGAGNFRRQWARKAALSINRDEYGDDEEEAHKQAWQQYAKDPQELMARAYDTAKEMSAAYPKLKSHQKVALARNTEIIRKFSELVDEIYGTPAWNRFLGYVTSYLQKM